jgi:hypothetical protein
MRDPFFPLAAKQKEKGEKKNCTQPTKRVHRDFCLKEILHVIYIVGAKN